MLQKLALFVDVQNIYYTSKQAYQRQFDYQKFWTQATANRKIVTAIAYAIDKGDSKQRGFQQRLRDIGFEVKLKPYLQRRDGSAKGDWDVGITLDIIDFAAQVDVVTLLSGDGDFDLLLAKVHQCYGVITEVYGVPALTSSTLIQSAQRFIAIDDKLLL